MKGAVSGTIIRSQTDFNHGFPSLPWGHFQTMDNFKIDSITPETFREIFQGSAEGILMVNEDGVILLANPVSERSALDSG